MILQHLKPAAALADVVCHYSIIEFEKRKQENLIGFVPPGICTGFFFVYRMDKPVSFQVGNSKRSLSHDRVYLLTPTTKPIRHEFFGTTGFFRVVLQPGVLYQLLGIPLHQLTGKLIKATDVFGEDIIKLRCQVLDAPTNKVRKAFIEAYLLRKTDAQFSDDNPLRVISKHLDQSIEVVTVAQLKAILGISERSLERLFQKYIGLSPRNYLSIRRLCKVLSMLHKNPNQKLVDLAFQCGYFDQPHFNRSFKKWMGVSPKDYLVTMNRPLSGLQAV